MAVRIGLIHGVSIAMTPVQQTFERLWPEAVCTNLRDDSLSPDRESDGVLTDAMCERIRDGAGIRRDGRAAAKPGQRRAEPEAENPCQLT